MIRLVEHARARIAVDAAALLTGESAGSAAQCAAPSCDRLLLRTHARKQGTRGVLQGWSDSGSAEGGPQASGLTEPRVL